MAQPSKVFKQKVERCALTEGCHIVCSAGCGPFKAVVEDIVVV